MAIIPESEYTCPECGESGVAKTDFPPDETSTIENPRYVHTCGAILTEDELEEDAENNLGFIDPEDPT